jgi:adenosine deaminase
VLELSKRRVPLAVCLHSNVRLGVFSSLEEHSLRTLWDAGVPVSVNTDDPGYFECDMVDEFAAAGRLLGLDREGYGLLALNSVEISFAPEDVKSDMRSGIADWMKKG